MWRETNPVYTALLPLKPIGNYKGFWLLVAVIEEILKQPHPYYNLTRDIYPVVAAGHCCKSSSIERNLRTLILNMDMTVLTGLIGVDIPDRLTVSRLIDLLVVYMFSID